ncbi:MAG: hypothetical protein JW779_15670 [Candidatus Thorarchaeota archaeon]|nr:hypothetical protein [Candidatus Thorarchaeota archaeon]
MFLTHELRSTDPGQSDQMPFFICDGVVKLDTLYSAGAYVRTMRIVKMR